LDLKIYIYISGDIDIERYREKLISGIIMRYKEILGDIILGELYIIKT